MHGYNLSAVSTFDDLMREKRERAWAIGQVVAYRIGRGNIMLSGEATLRLAISREKPQTPRGKVGRPLSPQWGMYSEHVRTAAMMIAAIGNIANFENAAALKSYFGWTSINGLWKPSYGRVSCSWLLLPIRYGHRARRLTLAALIAQAPPGCHDDEQRHHDHVRTALRFAHRRRFSTC